MIQTECGLCCVAMIANYYKHYVSINELRKNFPPGRDGLSVRIIGEMLKYAELDCKIYKSNIKGLLSLKCPLIVYIRKSHFIVVEKIKSNKIYAVDPGLGNIVFTLDEFAEDYSEIAISALCPKTDKKYNRKKSIWCDLLPVFLKRKGNIVLMITASLASYACALIMSRFIQTLIDVETTDISRNLMAGLVIILFYFGLIFINSAMGSKYKISIFQELYKKVFHKLIYANYSFYENRPVGGILHSLSSVSSVNDFYTNNVVSAIVSMGAIIALSIYLIVISPILYLSVLLLYTFFSCLYLACKKHLEKKHQEKIIRSYKQSIIQNEIITNIESVKINGRTQDALREWSDGFSKLISKTYDSEMARNISGTALSGISTIVPIIAILITALFSVQSGSTIGTMVSIYSILNILTSHILTLLTTITELSMANNYLVEIQDIIEEQEEENGEKVLNDVDQIDVSNLSYRYNVRSEYVLKNINLTIKKGQKIAIVGSSGSGKSTLAKLLIELYIPTQGNIKLNGKDINIFNKDSVRKNVCMIPQNGKVFNKTILNNLTMLRDEKEVDDVLIDLCKRLDLYDEIMNMPMKFETLLSEQGANISGGQRQKILVIRAILSNAKFIIMDEATCSMDAVNEKRVYDTLKDYNCSQIIITHRLSTITDSDIIYVLKDGMLVEQGTHRQLMSIAGEYAKLYDVFISEQ